MWNYLLSKIGVTKLNFFHAVALVVLDFRQAGRQAQPILQTQEILTLILDLVRHIKLGKFVTRRGQVWLMTWHNQGEMLSSLKVP